MTKEELEKLEEFRKTYTEKLAEELCNVQPMPNVDWDLLGQSWLWQSFMNRHFNK